MTPLTLKAYAKINTVLKVGAKRADGFHDIDTVLQLISLNDVIKFTPSVSLSLECSVPELSGEANIAWKALRLMSELLDPPKVAIFIEKNIPTQAGLGGGSSDAACVLRGVLSLLAVAPAEADTKAIASACGADVPYFLFNVARARATGKGEIIERLAPQATKHIVVAKPSIGVATAGAYAALDAIRDRIPSAGDDANDFERVAPAESLELRDRLRTLGATAAHLCGSGSAVYGEVDSKRTAEAFAVQLQREGYWAQPATTLEAVDG